MFEIEVHLGLNELEELFIMTDLTSYEQEEDDYEEQEEQCA